MAHEELPTQNIPLEQGVMHGPYPPMDSDVGLERYGREDRRFEMAAAHDDVVHAHETGKVALMGVKMEDQLAAEEALFQLHKHGRAAHVAKTEGRITGQEYSEGLRERSAAKDAILADLNGKSIVKNKAA